MNHARTLGRTLIISNPASQSGAGEAVAWQLKRFLSMYLDDPDAFELVFTERPHHATELAAAAEHYNAVVALGGDGVIHEVAGGLMRHPRATRPALGIIPVGSGNDYARTLGITERGDASFEVLLKSRATPLDVGRADFERAGGHAGHFTEYFIETLSIGLDAAIAIDTYELRTSTHLRGSALYTASGLRVFGAGYRDYPMSVSFDGAPAERLRPYLIAIQIGPTYGSGYQICPAADPADGLFDICYAVGPAPRLVTVPLFLRAKHGNHMDSKLIHTTRAASVELELAEDAYPIQADGEQLRARRLSITMLPGALDVLVPQSFGGRQQTQ